MDNATKTTKNNFLEVSLSSFTSKTQTRLAQRNSIQPKLENSRCRIVEYLIEINSKQVDCITTILIKHQTTVLH